MSLRGALLGAGNIALSGHLPAYTRVAGGVDRCRIVAAADLSEENLDRVSATDPAVRTYTDAERLLAEMQPDFVDICAPPFTHRALVELAIAHGCHILCEKPLSTRLAEADALAASLAGKPLVFVPGHQYHYAPAWRAVRAAVGDDEIGGLRSGRVTIERQAANLGNRHWQPAWRTRESLSGGGILMDHGTHLFYQLSSLFGAPRRISATVGVARHVSYDVEDTARCDIEFAAGSVRLDLTWAADRRRTVHRYHGSAGRITCDESTVVVDGRAGRREVHLGAGFSQDSSHADWYVPLLNDFLRRIEERDYDRAPLEEALLAVRCAEAAYASARSGRAIHLA